MNYLKELPEGTIWPHLIDAIRNEVSAQLHDVAAIRADSVKRGVESPELAATLLDAYVDGLFMSLAIDGIDNTLRADADNLVRSIDPNFTENRRRRWSGAKIVYDAKPS